MNKTRKRLSDRNTRQGFHYLPLGPSLLPFDPYSLASLSSPHREVWELSPQCGCSGCYPRIFLKCNAVCSIAVYFSNKSVALHKSVVSHFVIQHTLSEMGVGSILYSLLHCTAVAACESEPLTWVMRRGDDWWLCTVYMWCQMWTSVSQVRVWTTPSVRTHMPHTPVSALAHTQVTLTCSRSR